MQLPNAATLWSAFYVANFKVVLTVEINEIEQKYCVTLLPREQKYILEVKLPLSYHFCLTIQILVPSQKNWFFLNHLSHLVFSDMLLSAMYNYLYFQRDCVFVFYPKKKWFSYNFMKVYVAKSAVPNPELLLLLAVMLLLLLFLKWGEKWQFTSIFWT